MKVGSVLYRINQELQPDSEVRVEGERSVGYATPLVLAGPATMGTAFRRER
jgi:hypothetical protein